MTMKKIEVLQWGLQHIAANHGYNANVDYQEEGSMCIYGGTSVPMLADVRMLCECVGVSTDAIEESPGFGVDVYLSIVWVTNDGMLTAEYQPNPAMEMWKRHGVEIGS